jgi:hypothetical protein
MIEGGMLKAFRAAASFVALVSSAVCSAAPAARDAAQAEAPAPNRLTPTRPEVRLVLPARPNPSSVIVLRVSALKNPSNAAFSLETALASCTGATKAWEPEHLASLGVYPPDQAATYTLPVTAATLSRLRDRGVADIKDACLQVRVRVVREPADGLEVTLGALEWRDPK